ncbi:MAG: putative transcriptional regulator, Crp/Fnr family [Flaviaesturariibacter sp.]|nr:putative transcriptional regulator, Crp/Fnr family [Flaviaesturariibacter sp.]
MDRDGDLLNLRTLFQSFGEIPDSDWELLLPHLQEKVLKKHDFFAEEGKTAMTVAYVIEGNLRQFYTKDGEERTTYFYFSGNLMCSYISCLTKQPSLLTIEALSDIHMLCFPYKVLEDLYERSHAWNTCGRRLAEYLATGLEERMVSLLLQSPEERYRSLLSSSKKRILEQIPQQYIASYLGITPVSLSRIRGRITKL